MCLVEWVKTEPFVLRYSYQRLPMTDKARKQEDLSNLMKSNTHGSSGSGPQIQTGLMPRSFDGSLAIPAPHPLAYGIMHPSLNVGGIVRPHPSVSNDLGPPIFMPSLNLGVPRQQTSNATQSFVSKQPKNTLTPPPIMATSFIQSDLPFPPQSLMFHHSQVRQTQPSYLPPSPPINMKTQHQPSNPPPSKVPHSKTVSKGMPGELGPSRTGIVRPTPKQPASLPAPQLHHGVMKSSAMSRSSMSKGEPPVDQLTYVLSPTPMGVHGNYVLSHPIPNQKGGSTLSKMLMSPAQQQTSVVSSTGRHKSGQEMGGAYVSHTTAPRTAVPALTSMATGGHTGAITQKMGSFASAVPDGYSGRSPLSDHATPPSLATSGQPSSTTSFVDTKTERPPQPSAGVPPSPQPSGPGGLNRTMITDVVPNIIIKGSNLSGRHIAAITNNTTLQHTGGGAVQPAYASNSQSNLPQTVESHMKSEYGHVPVDTGWIHPPPPDHNAGSPSGNPGQLFGNLVQQPGNKLVQPGGGVVVPTASASVTLGLAVHTHSPGGSHLMSSPGGHQHLPNPQGAGTSPRPQILRKRPLESGGWKDGHPNSLFTSGSPVGSKLPPGHSSLKQGGVGDHSSVPLSPTSEGGVASHNHSGVRPEVNDLSSSPRKKPRKQNVIANDDQYASNVPDSLSSSSASSLDTAVSGEGSEESGRSLMNSAPIKATRVKGESLHTKDGAPPATSSWEVEVRYLRRCPYPIGGEYKACHRAPHNHFKQHSDIKHKDEVRPTAVQLASDKYAYQRAEGWRVHHLLSQLHEMTRVEQELLEQVQLLQETVQDIDQSESCVIDKDYINNFNELLECNLVRCTRVRTHLENTKTQTLQIFDHHPQVNELLQKCSSISPPHLPSSSLLSNHHKSRN